MLWPAWDDVSVVALGTFTFVASATEQGQGVDLIEKGGLVAVGVLLCLNVVVQILNQVLPLLGPKKAEPGDKRKPSDDSIRFRADVLRSAALVEQMAQQVEDLHKWHCDEFERALSDLAEEVEALKQRQS